MNVLIWISTAIIWSRTNCAHQWFGDLLTCKDWGETWLNESFATYFATLWAEHDLGWDEAVWARHLEEETYKATDRRYRRPIVSYTYNDPNGMFDAHSYPKGGRVLHMLRFVLGDDLFWKAIHNYVERHRFGTVEAADLRIAIEESTGQGLNWFFDEWLAHGGFPEFNVSWRWDDCRQNRADDGQANAEGRRGHSGLRNAGRNRVGDA